MHILLRDHQPHQPCKRTNQKGDGSHEYILMPSKLKACKHRDLTPIEQLCQRNVHILNSQLTTMGLYAYNLFFTKPRKTLLVFEKNYNKLLNF